MHLGWGARVGGGTTDWGLPGLCLSVETDDCVVLVTGR